MGAPPQETIETMTEQPVDSTDPNADLDVRARRTPLYEAYNAPRYCRQDLVRTIRTRTERTLICYVAGERTSIHREDIPPFVDLLHHAKPDSDLDLMLHTGGGDVDAAEKLINLVRTKVGEATLRVIVPDYAKSAGTLIAIGANVILMSDSSELGPIDPQVVLADANGNRLQHSVFTYLGAYEKYRDAVKENADDIEARIMLSKLEPQTVEWFQRVLQRSTTLAGQLLSRDMLKEDANWTLVLDKLIDKDRWLSHGQAISADDAAEMGLKITYQKPDSLPWQDFWRLYCLQRLAITETQKLFESDYVSLPLDSSAIYS